MTASARSRHLQWLLAAAALVVLALAAWWWLRPTPVPQPDLAYPADQDFDFVWRDGDVRGVDTPQFARIWIQEGRERKEIRIPVRWLADVVSEPGEPKLAFLEQARAYLVQHASITRTEACGQICRSPDQRFAVRLMTYDSHIRCAVPNICPPGFTSQEEHIHVHCPRRATLTANHADELMTGKRIRAGQALPTCDDERFSAQDLRAERPGYLATPSRVLRAENRAWREVAAAQPQGQPHQREALAAP